MDRRDFIKKSAVITAIGATATLDAKPHTVDDVHIKDGLEKSKLERKDLKISTNEYSLINTLNNKLREVRGVVGYGNFNLLDFDDCVAYSRNYSKLGGFSKKELDKLEELFYQSADSYGFYGDKVLTKLTAKINKREVVKVPYTGHYLFKGKSVYLYDKIRNEVGSSIILTSGVRGVVKQMQLFISKAVITKGNMSQASRSLAPPGYSYHGIGDFDVGRIGFGYRNFTEDFASTDEYKRLMDLGYVDIRYPEHNPYGVRYEPWHIKVSS